MATPKETNLPGVPTFDHPQRHELLKDADPEIQRVAEDLHRDGYAVIDFPDPGIGRLMEEIQAALTPRFDFGHWREKLWPVSDGLRLQDIWQEVEAVRRIACNERILEILSAVFGRKAFPFQTLNFPVGTQQTLHSDAAFFSSVPDGFMCGVWLAFEATDESNGALQYAPGSHRAPLLTNDLIGMRATGGDQKKLQERLAFAWQDLVKGNGYRPEIFEAKKGQALIWSAHLLHGGSRHADIERTRWSQVTHYYFEDCLYWTPSYSDTFEGHTYVRAPFNILTGETEESTYLGRPVPASEGAAGPAAMPARGLVGKAVRRVARRVAAHSVALAEGFDEEAYLAANPDVRASGLPPKRHWLRYGYREGRKLR